MENNQKNNQKKKSDVKKIWIIILAIVLMCSIMLNFLMFIILFTLNDNAPKVDNETIVEEAIEETTNEDCSPKITTIDGKKAYCLYGTYEAVSLAKLRAAIAKSAYHNLIPKDTDIGEIDSEELDILKAMIKEFNEGDWFKNDHGEFFGLEIDTDQKQVTYILNDDYCAKFTVKEEDGKEYLIDYSFEETDISKFNKKDIVKIEITNQKL